MKIETWDEEVYIYAGNEEYWAFRFFIIMIEAKTYNKTKKYVQDTWSENIIKIADRKW